MPRFFLPQDSDGYDGASPRQNVFEGLSREPVEGGEADAGRDSDAAEGAADSIDVVAEGMSSGTGESFG
jgi:hypothetical protein